MPTLFSWQNDGILNRKEGKMVKSVLRGIFLTSEYPAVTATFYRDVAGLRLEQAGEDAKHGYWKMDDAGVQFAIHDAKKFAGYTHPANPQSNVTHLYFKIENQAEFLEHLKDLNIRPYATDDIVVTVIDPDGRKVMFGTL
jgi:hypothetical protein